MQDDLTSGSQRPPLSDIAGGLMLAVAFVAVALLDWPAMDQALAALWGGP